MNKKLKLSLLAVIGTIFILGTSLVLAKPSFIMGDFFQEKKNKMEMVSEDSYVVTSDEFSINEREFVDYKENVKLVHQLNKIPFKTANEELVQQMIDDRLMLQYAKKQKINVTDDEIMEYALQTKEAFTNATPELNELLKELSNSLSVSTDDYFTHPKTLKNYKETLMVSKAVEQLYEQGILDHEEKTLELFIQDLKKEKEDKIKMNLEKVKNK